MSELVTGEAVVLDLRLARLPTRAMAFFIDAVVLVVVGIAVTFLLGAVLSGSDDAAASAISLGAFVLVIVGVPTAWETLSRGRSLGKLALGTRVVRDDGGPIRFRHALTRALAGVFVDFLLTSGAGAIICSLLNSKGKRVGDILAGTVVVKERTPAQLATLPPLPPQLVHWTYSLELSRLPDELALAVRSYLTRIASMAPAARDAMGASLAASVSAYVTPPPPPGTPPWAFLTGVLTERRRRSEAGLHAYATSAIAWPSGLVRPQVQPYGFQAPTPPAPPPSSEGQVLAPTGFHAPD